jgi:hypothetical protein
MSRRLCIAATTACLAAAGCGQTASPVDGGADMSREVTVAHPDLAPGPDLAPVPNPMMPQLAQHNGGVLSSTQLVTVTFPGYKYKSDVESWGDFVFTSTWLHTVGDEYGVGPGAHLAKYVMATASAKGITDAEISLALKQLFDANTAGVPKPTGQTSQNLYMVYFPSTTTVTQPDGSDLCGSIGGFAGYHSSAVWNNSLFPYAIVGDCGNGVGDITNTASHELIEAATDPFEHGAYFLDPDPSDPWIIEAGQEVADMCEWEDSANEGGFALARSWSNVAAMAGKDPCVPAPAGPYVNVRTDPAAIPTVAAGATFTYHIIGWATGEAQPWQIQLADASASNYPLTSLGPTCGGQPCNGRSIFAGSSIPVTITIPTTAQSGDIGGFMVYSGPEQHWWPVAFTVQ